MGIVCKSLIDGFKRRIHLKTLFALLYPTICFADFQSGVSDYKNGDYKNAIIAWEELHEQGNVYATYNMAASYLKGEPSSQSKAEGLLTSIQDKLPQSKLLLSHILIQSGDPASFDKAFELLLSLEGVKQFALDSYSNGYEMKQIGQYLSPQNNKNAIKQLRKKPPIFIALPYDIWYSFNGRIFISENQLQEIPAKRTILRDELINTTELQDLVARDSKYAGCILLTRDLRQQSMLLIDEIVPLFGAGIRKKQKLSETYKKRIEECASNQIPHFQMLHALMQFQLKNEMSRELMFESALLGNREAMYTLVTWERIGEYEKFTGAENASLLNAALKNPDSLPFSSIILSELNIIEELPGPQISQALNLMRKIASGSSPVQKYAMDRLYVFYRKPPSNQVHKAMADVDLIATIGRLAAENKPYANVILCHHNFQNLRNSKREQMEKALKYCESAAVEGESIDAAVFFTNLLSLEEQYKDAYSWALKLTSDREKNLSDSYNQNLRQIMLKAENNLTKSEIRRIQSDNINE